MGTSTDQLEHNDGQTDILKLNMQRNKNPTTLQKKSTQTKGTKQKEISAKYTNKRHKAKLHKQKAQKYTNKRHKTEGILCQGHKQKAQNKRNSLPWTQTKGTKQKYTNKRHKTKVQTKGTKQKYTNKRHKTKVHKQKAGRKRNSLPTFFFALGFSSGSGVSSRSTATGWVDAMDPNRSSSSSSANRSVFVTASFFAAGVSAKNNNKNCESMIA